jgi:predicted O-linked N-acetylglucosamine transferase (SPINDLY family)
MNSDQLLQEAIALHQAGELTKAEALYRQVLSTEPNNFNALHLLGVLCFQTRRATEALEWIREALNFNRSFALAWFNLGNVLKVLGRLEEAAEAYRHAIEFKSEYAEAYDNLGNVLMDQGQLEEAVACYRQSLELKPGSALTHNSLGTALKEAGHLDEAITSYAQALAIKPDYVMAHYNIGNARKDQWQTDEAIRHYRQALQLDPDHVDSYNNLGATFRDQGLIQESIDCFRHSLLLKPDSARIHSNVLFALNYPADSTMKSLHGAHLDYAARHATPLAGEIQPLSNELDPDRRLHIGYVSADLRRHPTGYFLESVLAAHDPSQVEITCYSDTSTGDEISARLQTHSQHWHDCIGLDDAALAARIRDDGIDILIDLSGHTAGNRLLVFARKPAPVQVAWLGYFNTTGLDSIDYGLWDAITVPPGNERWFSETVVRLPHSRFCYTPPEYAPVVVPPPLLERGYVTYGCFNNLAKLTPEVIALWAQLLQRVPDARLILKWGSFKDLGVQRRYRELFQQHGIDPTRIDLRGASPHREMLAEYGDMDIALDPFPFSGGLTSCEALWMGVPVVTLAGDLPVSRQTLGFLTQVGLSDLAATDPEQYLTIASELARDKARLQNLRLSLRHTMQASPLCDAKTFTRDLEAAYRAMWHAWCAK